MRRKSQIIPQISLFFDLIRIQVALILGRKCKRTTWIQDQTNHHYSLTDSLFLSLDFCHFKVTDLSEISSLEILQTIVLLELEIFQILSVLIYHTYPVLWKLSPTKLTMETTFIRSGFAQKNLQQQVVGNYETIATNGLISPASVAID